jgi:hypothetical protein
LTQTIQSIGDVSQYQIHGIGHSFGGALSTFIAADLVLSNLAKPQQISLTTFGLPRLGNYEFARWIDTDVGFKSIRRVIHSLDIFPHLPSTAFGYRHTGTEYWLDIQTKQLYKCLDVPPQGSKEGYDESPSCSNGTPSWKWTGDAHNSYYDTTQKTACPAAAVNTPPVEVTYLAFDEALR